MSKTELTLFLAVSASICGLDGWAAQRGGWKIANGTLTHYSDSGSRTEEFQLHSWKESPTEYRSFPRREVTAVVSKNGDYALVRRFESTFVEHVPSTTVTASFYDPTGQLVWVLHAVREDRLSDDGKMALLVLSMPEGCSIEEGPSCTESLVSINTSGKQLMRLGPYGSVGAWWSSKNLRYAGASVRLLHTVKTKYIFFSTESGGVGAEFDVLPGAPRIQDDGAVEFIRTEYASSGIGIPARAIRSETVKRIRLSK